MSELNALNLTPGDVVGGYTLVSRLGGGAMGTVWKVTDDGGTVFAMKILRDSLQDDEASQNQEILTARERFRREAVSLRKINHPGVCQIVDMELDDSLAFIVTELIEGKNLREDVKDNGRYTGADLERLARKLIDAVDAVHAAGIIHRDIKPTNVMISASGPVLVDFGIAMSDGESHVTRTGLVMGTPGFIAPEIIEGAESDEATDWWSVASVLGFAATGESIFGTKPMMVVLERAASGNSNLTGIPALTRQMLREALDPNRMNRCSAQELLNAISLDVRNGAWSDFEENSSNTDLTVGWGSGTINADSEDLTIQSHQSDSADINSAVANSGDEVVRPFGANSSLINDRFSDNSQATKQVSLEDSEILEDSEEYLALHNPRALWNRDKTITLKQSPHYRGNHDDYSDREEGKEEVEEEEDSAARTSAILAASATSVMPSSMRTAAMAQPTSNQPPLQDTRVMQTNQDSYEPNSGFNSEPNQQQGHAYSQNPNPPAIRPQSANYQYHQQPASGAQQHSPQAYQQQHNNIPAYAVLTWMRSHSGIPALMLALPFILLTCIYPISATFTMALVIWALTTRAHSISAREARREKHGGTLSSSDVVLTAVGLPWHIIKGFFSMLAPMLTYCISSCAALVLLSLSLGISDAADHAYMTLTFANITFTLNLPGGNIASLSGLILALSSAIGWTLCTLGRQTSMFGVGLGSFKRVQIDGYLEYSAAITGNEKQKPSYTTIAVLVLWALFVIITVVTALNASGIDWSPLSVVYSE